MTLSDVVTAEDVMRWLKTQKASIPVEEVAVKMYFNCSAELKTLAQVFHDMGWHYGNTITLLQFLDEAIKEKTK